MFYQSEHSSNEGFFSLAEGYRQNFSFPLHLHENCEFIYVEEGSLRVEINTCVFDLQGGEGALILPDQPHSFFTPEESESWIAIFSVDYVPELKKIALGKNFFSPIIKTTKHNLYESLSEARKNRFRLRSLLYELAALYIEGEAMPQIAMEDSALVCKAVEYINAHYTEDLTLEKMAQELGYSYRYMSGVVNRFFGLNLPQVVNRYRINAACEMLSEASREITEIAMLCGFGSIRNFNRSFKELTGMTPQQYRNKKTTALQKD